MKLPSLEPESSASANSAIPAYWYLSCTSVYMICSLSASAIYHKFMPEYNALWFCPETLPWGAAALIRKQSLYFEKPQNWTDYIILKSFCQYVCVWFIRYFFKIVIDKTESRWYNTIWWAKAFIQKEDLCAGIFLPVECTSLFFICKRITESGYLGRPEFICRRPIRGPLRKGDYKWNSKVRSGFRPAALFQRSFPERETEWPVRAL